MESIEISYEAIYTKELNMTIIFEHIKSYDKLCCVKNIKTSISGFYYGEPSIEATLQFKNKNYILEEEE